MTLSEEQKDVLRTLASHNEGAITLGGLAGVGKTTVVGHLMKLKPSWAVATPTGKAADVLRRRGVASAQTIHSLIYKPSLKPDGRIEKDEDGNPIFILNPELAHSGIIVDEASMVSRFIYEDLLSFNIPLVFVGDHGQLEPINDKFNLMANPDLRLETIHRNAGPIARFAHHIRRGLRSSGFQDTGEAVEFAYFSDIDELIPKVDQIICAFNKTRVAMNRRVRGVLGIGDGGDFPVVGDRVICLKNSKERGVFNGMQGEVIKLYQKPRNRMEFLPDGSDMPIDIMFDPGTFNVEKPVMEHGRGDPIPFDFAYCITAHKSQGSEIERLLVLEQFCRNWEHKRWAYTAASRAKSKLYWIENFKG